MIEVRPLFNIELRPDEEVVTAVQHRDYILVITNRGSVYQIIGDER